MMATGTGMRRSIAGIAFREGKVLIAKRRAGGDIGLRWEFPGGKVEEGEDDAGAIKREFLEEFGVAVEPGPLLGTRTFTHRGESWQLAAWIVHIAEGSGFDLREHSQLEWIRPEDLESYDLADSDRLLIGLVRGKGKE